VPVFNSFNDVVFTGNNRFKCGNDILAVIGMKILGYLLTDKCILCVSVDTLDCGTLVLDDTALVKDSQESRGVQR
jgi:hypothetical protein